MLNNSSRTAYKSGLFGPTLSQVAALDVAMPSERTRYEAFEIDLSHQLADPVPVVSIRGQTICSRGNISAIVGEAKSKKTFLCSALVGGLLSATGYMGFDPRDMRVLWIDTEQADAHVHKVIRRTHAIACLDCTENDPHLRTLALRELDPKRRMDMAIDAIMDCRPDLVVIDGVSDLQFNTNDLEESERVVTQLMKLSSALKMHILCVLHTNPNSDKARGHTGSSLQRKAETVMYVHRVGHTSVVEAQFCRNEPFERFAFSINEQSLPELCDLPMPPESDNSCVKLLREEFGGAVERPVLVRRLALAAGIPESAAKMRVHRALRQGLLRASEDGREVTVATPGPQG